MYLSPSSLMQTSAGNCNACGKILAPRRHDEMMRGCMPNIVVFVDTEIVLGVQS